MNPPKSWERMRPVKIIREDAAGNRTTIRKLVASTPHVVHSLMRRMVLDEFSTNTEVKSFTVLPENSGLPPTAIVLNGIDGPVATYFQEQS